jgi:hypothetical protein
MSSDQAAEETVRSNQEPSRNGTNVVLQVEMFP